MSLKVQKIICACMIALAGLGGLEVLIFILNLNQPAIYLRTALWIFLYLVFSIVFLFDLHVKVPGSWQRAKKRHGHIASAAHRGLKITASAAWERFEHLRRWEFISQWLHFLLIPGFIFWASVSLFYNNFGMLKIQQTIALLSGTALVVYYWHLKEVFRRGREAVDTDIFTAMMAVKIYAVLVLYAASLAMLRYFCLNPVYFSVEVFCYSFLFIYQALYQNRRVTGPNILVALLIGLGMAGAAWPVYLGWGFNYFTAAVCLTAVYNLFWGLFHYRLDGILTPRAFTEILLVTLLIVAMVVSVTNFKSRILDGCNYQNSFRIF